MEIVFCSTVSPNTTNTCALTQRAVVTISHEAEANIARILHDVRRESQTDGSPSSRDSPTNWESGRQTDSPPSSRDSPTNWQSGRPNTSWSSNPSLSWGSQGSRGACGVGQQETYSSSHFTQTTDVEAAQRLAQVCMWTCGLSYIVIFRHDGAEKASNVWISTVLCLLVHISREHDLQYIHVCVVH